LLNVAFEDSKDPNAKGVPRVALQNFPEILALDAALLSLPTSIPGGFE